MRHPCLPGWGRTRSRSAVSRWGSRRPPAGSSSRWRATSLRLPADQAEDRTRHRRGAGRSRAPRIRRSRSRSTPTPPTLGDTEVFRRLDASDLLMVEQPLDHDDLVQHAELQRRIRTDCAWTNRSGRRRAEAALSLGSCRIITSSRAGGGVPEAAGCTTSRARPRCRCGAAACLETGIGRAQNLALAAMPASRCPRHQRVLAGPSSTTSPEPFEMAPTAPWRCPPGRVGVTPRTDRLEACTLRFETLRG